MPKAVDAQERSEAIIDAAMTLIAEGGFVNLTLSNIAKELGGSIRMITHYFKDRRALIQGILDEAMRNTNAVLAEMSTIDDPHRRIRHALSWFLLDDEQAVREEKVLVALLAHRGTEPTIESFFEEVDAAMRRVVHAAVEHAVARDKLESTIDLVRVWTSGLSLSVIERPDAWSLDKQTRALDDFLERMGLGSA